MGGVLARLFVDASIYCHGLWHFLISFILPGIRTDPRVDGPAREVSNDDRTRLLMACAFVELLEPRWSSAIKEGIPGIGVP